MKQLGRLHGVSGSGFTGYDFDLDPAVCSASCRRCVRQSRSSIAHSDYLDTVRTDTLPGQVAFHDIGPERGEASIVFVATECVGVALDDNFRLRFLKHVPGEFVKPGEDLWRKLICVASERNNESGLPEVFLVSRFRGSLGIGLA